MEVRNRINKPSGNCAVIRDAETVRSGGGSSSGIAQRHRRGPANETNGERADNERRNLCVVCSGTETKDRLDLLEKPPGVGTNPRNQKPETAVSLWARIGDGDGDDQATHERAHPRKSPVTLTP